MSRAHGINTLLTGTENRQGLVSASQPQSQPLMESSQALPEEFFGTTLLGIKMRRMVFLAAEGLATNSEDAERSKKNTVKLAWVTDSVFVARSGYFSHSHRVIQKVRKRCKDVPPKVFGDVSKLFVEEANKELDTIKKDDVERMKYTFVIGGRLHRKGEDDCHQGEDDCHLVLIERKHTVLSEGTVEYAYGSVSGDMFCHRGIDFFSRPDIDSRLKEADLVDDRAAIVEVIKEFFAVACTNDIHSKGRVTIATIDERGYHVFESAYPVDYDTPAAGYKESEVGDFYPDGYHTP